MRSEGVVVRASILARLFGLRLLTLEATVVVTPADLTRARVSPPEVTHSPPLASGVDHPLAEAVRTLAEAKRDRVAARE